MGNDSVIDFKKGKATDQKQFARHRSAKLNEQACRLTELSKSGGCGCKIDPSALSEILTYVPKTSLNENLLVGIEHSDDAAVYRISEDQALVFTNDFFSATVDDPFVYGRIAAANALSDVYAMGGTPLMANAIVGFPVDEIPMKSMQQIMQGGISVCEVANIPLSGGHSINNPQPIFGLAVVGTVHPNNIKTNKDSQIGDILILTKPLGIGIMSSAFKLKLISKKGYAEFVDVITQVNSPGSWLGTQPAVHAMTDITGFGLAGHLLEMANAADVCMEVEMNSVPIINEAIKHVSDGIVPSGAYRNMSSFTNYVSFSEAWDIDKQLIFSDPQTNGGLLISVAPESAVEIIAKLGKMGYENISIIGQVTERTTPEDAVRFI